MNQEDLLVLLLVFVLGFVVSQMMSGRLVEGGLLGDIEDDFKSLGKHIGDDTINIVHNSRCGFVILENIVQHKGIVQKLVLLVDNINAMSRAHKICVMVKQIVNVIVMIKVKTD